MPDPIADYCARIHEDVEGVLDELGYYFWNRPDDIVDEITRAVTYCHEVANVREAIAKSTRMLIPEGTKVRILGGWLGNTRIATIIGEHEGKAVVGIEGDVFSYIGPWDKLEVIDA